MDNQKPLETSLDKGIKKLMGKVEKAEAKLKVAASSKDRKKAHKELDDLKVQLAWQYLDVREFEKAARIYDKLPKDAHIRSRYCGQARILIETQKYDEARELLEKALAEFPDDVPVMNTLGILFNQTGEYYEALKYFDQIQPLNPQNYPSPLFNKVFSLRNLGYYEEERKLLCELLEGTPDNADLIAELAYCEGQRGNYLEAVNGCKKAIERGYETPLLYTWLCKAYHNLDFMHELLAAALEGVRKFPDQNAELYTFLGMAHMKLEQYEDARRVFEQGLAVDPEAEGIPELLAVLEQAPKQRKTKEAKKKAAGG